MEELQSTENLDREILEDARRKAFRILKAADETVRAAALGWEEKTRRAGEELERKYAGRTEKARNEIMARLPLDRRRSRSEKIEALLRSAMERTLAAMGREKLLGILEGELGRRLDFCREEGELEAALAPEAAPVFFYRNLSAVEAAGIFGRLLSPAPAVLREADIPGLPQGSFPLAGINSRLLRLTASVEATSQALLRDQREELLAALLGEGADND